MPYTLQALKTTVIITITSLIVACGGASDNASSVQTETPTSTPAPASPVTPSKQTTHFSHVRMHYDLLKNQPMIYGEAGSLPPYSRITHYIRTTKFSPKGSTTLHIQDSTNLLNKQLITYLSSDGNYYVGQIKTISSNGTLELIEPLKAPVNAGNNIWDFYGNASHANPYGFMAIADFAVKSLIFGHNTRGNHVLLGDSWFNEGNLHNRLIQKLPNASIINQGIGGNTSYDLIARFDRDVTPYAPDYVWILTGTNDYWSGISTAQFKANLNTLISKSKAIGAKVIIFDSSVGEGMGPTGIANQLQSEKYIDAVLELNR